MLRSTFVGWMLLAGAAPAQEPREAAQRPFLERHCFECHGPDSRKKALKLDFATWVKVYDRVSAGEMPPPDAAQPSKADAAAFLQTLGERLSKESLEQAARLEGERFRSALLSSISHDLKTPLATITGAVSSLRELGDKMTPESRTDLLVSIEEESDRLARFVANLLDMTRIEAGTVDAKRDWVDVGDVIHGALQRAARYFPGRVIETSIGKNLSLIRGDSVLLGQVLFNLIDNAVKYGGEAPISIYARIDADDVVISITDAGKGIAAKDLENIFEKFFRRGKSDGRTPGTGLGLAVTRQFVELLGGSMDVKSSPGKGSTFRVSIPRGDG